MNAPHHPHIVYLDFERFSQEVETAQSKPLPDRQWPNKTLNAPQAAEFKPGDVTVRLYTSGLHHLVQQHFAIWSARLYVRTRHPARRQYARFLIEKLACEAMFLYENAPVFTAPDVDRRELTVHIVSADAKDLLDTLVMVDSALVTFLYSGKSRSEVEHEIAPFLHELDSFFRFIYGARQESLKPVISIQQLRRNRVGVRQARFHRAKAASAKSIQERP